MDEFDAVAFFYHRATDGMSLEAILRALAAEAARRQAVKDAGICVQPVNPLSGAAWAAYREALADYKQAIEKGAGL